MQIIYAGGSRDFSNFDIIEETVNAHRNKLWVMGCARGADRLLAEQCAYLNVPHIVWQAFASEPQAAAWVKPSVSRSVRPVKRRPGMHAAGHLAERTRLSVDWATYRGCGRAFLFYNGKPSPGTNGALRQLLNRGARVAVYGLTADQIQHAIGMWPSNAAFPTVNDMFPPFLLLTPPTLPPQPRPLGLTDYFHSLGLWTVHCLCGGVYCPGSRERSCACPPEEQLCYHCGMAYCNHRTAAVPAVHNQWTSVSQTD